MDIVAIFAIFAKWQGFRTPVSPCRWWPRGLHHISTCLLREIWPIEEKNSVICRDCLKKNWIMAAMQEACLMH